MKTAPALPSLALAAVAALSACSVTAGDETFDQSIAALDSTGTDVESGTESGEARPHTPPTVTLKRGLFADMAALELECEIAYGPVLKVKPQGVADDGSERPQGLVTYGPVITIKPKGAADGGYDCPINEGDVIVKRDFGGVNIDFDLECGLKYGPIIKIKPKGGLSEDGASGGLETEQTYGPVITIKPKGFTGEGDGYDCAVRYGDVTLKRGTSTDAPQAAIECSEPGPLLSLNPSAR